MLYEPYLVQMLPFPTIGYTAKHLNISYFEEMALCSLSCATLIIRIPTALTSFQRSAGLPLCGTLRGNFGRLQALDF